VKQIGGKDLARRIEKYGWQLYCEPAAKATGLRAENL
jgi:hypothetical protein